MHLISLSLALFNIYTSGYCASFAIMKQEILWKKTKQKKTRAHRAHTPRAIAISPMAMPFLRDLCSLKFSLLLLMNFFVPF